MRSRTAMPMGSIFLALLLASPRISSAQAAPDGGPAGITMAGQPAGQAPALDPSVKRTYVPLNGGAYLYEAVKPGLKSRVGIVVMHSNANYMSFSACSELSRRGYRVLCVTRSAPGTLDAGLADLRRAVDYMRGLPGIGQVVLFGHSGGATLMTAYQMIAESGVASCQNAGRLHKCPGSLAGMTAADAVMLIDPNWGNAEMSLFSVDPAVTDDNDGMRVRPELDLFSPGNGFNPKGNSDYSPEFIRTWQRAVARREQELTAKALARLAAVEAGKGRFADDEPLIAAGINQTSNKLFAQDTHLMSHTAQARPLLHASGAVTNEIVYSVRLPRNLTDTTPLLGRGGEETTVRDFLTDHAIRVADDFGYGEDSVHGIDWTSTYSSPPGNVQSIAAPLLVMGMTGSWEFLASETIYELAHSQDKSIAFVEGASHMYTPCRECETTPGQFGDTVTVLFNHIDTWLAERFAKP